MTFKEWMVESLGDYIEDIANHGADAGYPYLSYYTDTCKLYDEYHEEIWSMLIDDASDFGQTELELIASFGGADAVCNDHTFKNLLVWYAAERTAQEIVREEEEE